MLSPETETPVMEPSHGPSRPDSIWAGSDPHGQAALFLIESLIHGLVEKSLMSAGDAVAIVEHAIEAQSDILSELGAASGSLHKAQTLLGAITRSLRGDLPAD